jgi:hypothetical protein
MVGHSSGWNKTGREFLSASVAIACRMTPTAPADHNDEETARAFRAEARHAHVMAGAMRERMA